MLLNQLRYLKLQGLRKLTSSNYIQLFQEIFINFTANFERLA
jgi:hypothetical protein